MVVAALGFTSVNKTLISNQSGSFLTLIIPYRNEENRIQNLLFSLENQKDTSSISKIIFVDDHSTDSSRAQVNNWITKQDLNCESHFLDQYHGKKRAIDLGVQKTLELNISSLFGFVKPITSKRISI